MATDSGGYKDNGKHASRLVIMGPRNQLIGKICRLLFEKALQLQEVGRPETGDLRGDWTTAENPEIS